MLRMGLKSILSLIAVFTFYTCIEPFNPSINGSESLLVVDGLISDSNSSFSVRLSRTILKQNSNPVMVTNATLFISDDTGRDCYLENTGKGIYKTDSLDFRGVAGRTYVLHIKTGEGMEYESDPCVMPTGSDIDSIYFKKDSELVNNGTENEVGIRIFVATDGSETESYYRWDFEETWKFRVSNPKKYDFMAVDTTFIPHHPVNEFCWKHNYSNEILISSDVSSKSYGSDKMPLLFIASDKSDRLLIQYSILVKQHSISKKEYDFWNNIKQVNESGDDIFGKQPYTVDGNIHNISNRGEKVLGYFQVSSVRERRDIPISEIVGLNLPYYHYPCTRIEMAPQDYPRSPLSPPLTWSDLYDMFCVTSDYYFVEPKYITSMNELDKMVFTTPECADCELTGTSIKPDFWTDLD